LKENNVLTIAALAFLALLLFVFSDFVFDDSKLMLNMDQLNDIGSRYVRAENFILPEWNSSRLGGMPTMDALFSDVYHPLTLIYFVLEPGRATGFKFILTIWFAFIAAYILARYLTDKWQWAALLGFLYACSPQYFTYIYGGHDGKMIVFAAAPFAMYALIRLLREGSVKHGIYFSFSVVWMVLSPHLQLTYFFLWGAGLFVLFELFSNPLSAKIRITRLGLASLALAIGLMISAFQIIPPYLYTTTESVRGTEEKTTIEHSASWSLHGEELAAIILPGFLGVDVHKEQPGKNDNAYWGQNQFKLNSDACGALLTFLALCGCLLPSNRKQALFWFFGCVIALSYAVGLHSFLFAFWYNIIPGIKSFRAPTMSIHWLPLVFVFLAASTLKSLETKDGLLVLKKGAVLYGVLLMAVLIARYFWESFAGFGSAVLVVVYGALFIKTQNDISPLSKRSKILWAIPFLIVANFFLNPVSGSYFKSVNFAIAENLFSHSLTSFIVIAAVTAAALFILLNVNMSIIKKALLLAIIAAIDLAVVDFPFIKNVPSIQYYNPNHPVIQAIKKDSPNEMERPRVLTLTRQPSISGNIFPAYNMRNAFGSHDNEIASYRVFREQWQNQAMLDLMNVGYIIYDSERGTGVEKNSSDLGRAKVYYEWESINSNERIIEQLKDNNFDYRNVLLINWRPLHRTNPQSDNTIKTTTYKMDKINFEVESSADGMLFISENYHKYWKAEVNGKDEHIYKAFSTFMAVPIPKGKSYVEMRYASDSTRMSLWIGLAGVILLLGLAFFGFAQKKL
jgi:hypothetical protein